MYPRFPLYKVDYICLPSLQHLQPCLNKVKYRADSETVSQVNDFAVLNV